MMGGGHAGSKGSKGLDVSALKVDGINLRLEGQPLLAPGPVALRFIRSMGPIDLIRGPFGSGKTTAAIMKLIRHAAIDFPVCKPTAKYPNGYIAVRVAAVRDTYREMAKTALASWLGIFPKDSPYTAKETGAYSGGQDRPVKHVLEFDVMRKFPDGFFRAVPLRFEMEFGAVGDQNLESFVKGYEISMGFLNECNLINKDLPGLLYGRTGRWPRQIDICEWEGERLGWEIDPDSGEKSIKVPRIICGDFNPPDETNWTYEREIEEPENWPGYHFFAQPSGLSPLAENRRGRSRAKYEADETAFGGPDAPDARRNVHGEYAAVNVGTRVYNRFSINKHRSDERLMPVRALPFYIGLDAGGTPAALIGQFMPNGQLRMLREIVTSPDTITGPDRFADMIMNVLLQDFSGMACRAAWGDPSAFHGADTQRGELHFMGTVARAIGINILPTETNDLKSRIGAVDFYLGDIDANTPRMIICPSMKTFVRGFVSQYHTTKHFKEGKTASIEIDKNKFSHIHDAAQYLCLGYRGGYRLREDQANLGRADNVTMLRPFTAKSDFNVFNV